MILDIRCSMCILRKKEEIEKRFETDFGKLLRANTRQDDSGI